MADPKPVEFDWHQYVELRCDTVEAQIDALETLINERDRQYGYRFSASEEAVRSALAAQDKFNQMVTQASREAVSKAEIAQQGVNERSNEFRGQLSDQASTLMPRREAEAGMLDIRNMIDREIKMLRSDISGLRESRSALEGGTARGISDQGRQQWILGFALSVAGFAFGVITFLLLNVVVK
jgi:hypothetical protein